MAARIAGNKLNRRLPDGFLAWVKKPRYLTARLSKTSVTSVHSEGFDPQPYESLKQNF